MVDKNHSRGVGYDLVGKSKTISSVVRGKGKENYRTQLQRKTNRIMCMLLEPRRTNPCLA